MLEGANAVRALADAQRDWISDKLPRLEAHLRADREHALRRFAADLEFAGEVRGGIDGALLASPMTWAAFRFVGIADWRPTAEWHPIWERPLTDDEQREVDALMTAAEP